LNIVVHRGAGSYVCGDETALMESLEGKRGNPRVKPPFPASYGLYGCPTIVNNVETLSCLPFIMREGTQAFLNMGGAGGHGPKIFGVSGHVNKPGVYEFPMGTSLQTVLDAAGGVKGRLKGVIVGGMSVPILLPEEAKNLKLDYEGCSKAGTALGSAGIMVVNDTVSIPQLALRTISFYEHESCGQCTPCREGSLTIKTLIKRLIEWKGARSDIDRIITLCNTISGLTICPTGDAFSQPIRAMVQKYRSEFEALVR
jgi:NADH:ubiquinone oxidoreductase subunit F (NADH-binding)